MAALLVGCETALYMINRLKAYLEFWHNLPSTLTRTNLEDAMVKLYARILSFLAHAIQVYQQSSLERAFNSFWRDSDVQHFEQTCLELGNQVETEASNCDRTLRAEDTLVMRRSLQELDTVLQEIQQIRQLQAALLQIEKKTDLDKLKFVEGATFDAYGQVHTACHPETRQDLLKKIQEWATQPDSKSIFWLQGMAGTGKSTISWTIADWLSNTAPRGLVDLGASFFFKRGEGDRGSAKFLFPTIIRHLAQTVPGLDELVAQALGSNPDICTKSIGEQFRTLLRQPLQQLIPLSGQPVYVIVIDALDECKTDEIHVVLRLWSGMLPLTNIRIRLFLTSRPDQPVLLGFKELFPNGPPDIILHEVPRPIVERDIFVYLRDSFAAIRKNFNSDDLCEEPLEEDWPGEKTLQELADIATPLFIAAATICRFVSEPEWDARDRLVAILTSRKLGHISQLPTTYIPVLEQIVAPTRDRTDTADKNQLYHEFRMIAGAIVTLAEPLSRAAIATLLHLPAKTVALRLKPLYSVLQIPTDANAPVRPLHLSFGEFLTSPEIQHRPFAVDSTFTHAMMFSKCIELLSRLSDKGLNENMCNLTYPGQPRKDLSSDVITLRLPSEMQYACRYWTYHAQQSKMKVRNDDEVHMFLKEHLLHWLEALSLLDCLANALDYVTGLQLLVAENDSVQVSAFIEDARRFILANRYISDVAPLQLYSSAKKWSAELQKLVGHGGAVNAVAFFPDGTRLASGSSDHTVRLWDAQTGEELQQLAGHSNSVNAVAFSPDGTRLASGSDDHTVRLWDAQTGKELQQLAGHSGWVCAVVFSPDGTRLASGSYDHTVRLWDAQTGEELQELAGHSGWVSAVAFSPDGTRLASGSSDDTVRLWDVQTGEEECCFTDRPFVREINFSSEGQVLRTNRGIIHISAHLSASETVEKAGNNLVLSEDWVKFGNKNVLWLPHEYRSSVSAVRDNLIAIGRVSGHVSFLQITQPQGMNC